MQSEQREQKSKVQITKPEDIKQQFKKVLQPKRSTSLVIEIAHRHVAMLSRIMFNKKLTAEIAPKVKPKYPAFPALI
jgi:hypothetical protein